MTELLEMLTKLSPESLEVMAPKMSHTALVKSVKTLQAKMHNLKLARLSLEALGGTFGSSPEIRMIHSQRDDLVARANILNVALSHRPKPKTAYLSTCFQQCAREILDDKTFNQILAAAKLRQADATD